MDGTPVLDRRSGGFGRGLVTDLTLVGRVVVTM
jgi:hypothetical protein